MAVIAGAGPGLGATLAFRFAAAGATVAALARSSRSLDAALAAVDAAGGSAQCFRVDVTNPDGVRNAAEAVADRHGGADVLVNLAFGGNAILKWPHREPFR